MDKPATTDQPRLGHARRIRRWSVRLIAGGLICLGVVWLVQMLLLPVIINQQFAKALDRLGFAHPKFQVKHASITGAEVADIRAGEDNAIEINRITVTYSPIKVLAGHLDTIIIAGAEIKLAIGNGKTKLISPHDSKSSSGNSLPFDRIEVRSSTLKVDWEDRHFWLPVDGAMEVEANEKLKLSARTFFRGVDVPITGTLTDGFKNFSVHAQAQDITVAGLLSALPQRWTKSIPAIGGALNLDAELQKSASEYALELTVKGPDVQMHTGSATVRGFSTSLHFVATSDSNGLAIRSANDSKVGIDSIEFGVYHSSPVSFALANGPVLSRQGESATQVSLDLHTIAPASLSAETLNASIGSLGLNAVINVSSGNPPDALGQIKLDNVSVSDAEAKLQIAGASATIPFDFNAHHKDRSEITVKSITLNDTPLPSPSGTAWISNGQLKAEILWEPVEGAKLTTSADFSRDAKQGWHGQVAMAAPNFVISDPNTWRKIVKSKGDFDITGTFNLDAKAEFEDGRMRPRVRLKAENAAISSKQYDFTIEGLSADLTLWRLWPVATTGSQVIKAKSFRFGKMNLTDGLIQLRINDPHSILVEKTTWSWSGGHLDSYAIQLDPAKPVADFTLYADNLNVGEVLHFNFPDKNMSGQGNLYGKLPVSIKWPMIQFGNGFLYSAPGSGELSFGTEANTVADLVAGSNPSNDVKAQFHEQLIQALKNFRYDLVKADFVNQADGSLTASIHFKGKGASNGSPLDITFNINGIDVIFRNVLVVKKLIESIGK